MTSAMDVLDLFRKQVERHSGLKTVLVPSPIKEPGLVGKIALRKLMPAKSTFHDRKEDGVITLRISVSVESRIESQSAYRKAVDSLESLVRYARAASRLEDEAGKPILNATLRASLGDDDGLLEDPDNERFAWLREEILFEVTIPASM
jgi:hypothetical protein